MSSRLTNRYTVEEYLELERNSPEKHQYLDGEVFDMGGASEPHNLIVVNIAGELRFQFRDRPFKVYANDMRVKTGKKGLYTYPDIAALCGAAAFDDQMKDTLLNPTVIVEVLYPSTEAYDRGGKFERYRQIETLMEYVLVSAQKPHIERYLRQLNGEWIFSETSGHDSLRLTSIDCMLALDSVYEKVDFASQGALSST